jgi:dTDP-D-glucose 4,6-dehydratase
VVSSERLRQELGYQEIIPLDEALRRTIAWERANPPVQVDATIFDYELEDRIFEEMV